jgi:hypothetical protein
VKWRATIITAGVVCAAVAGVVLWVIHARLVGHWLEVHTGTINETGPYYGFWSGFGSDLTEFGIIGAIATGVYQLVKKYNCHYPGCWRVGNHPAAGGQFSLCYLHHPDYQGKKPTRELIERLHQEHLERQAALARRFRDFNEHLTDKHADASGVSSPGAPTGQEARTGDTQASPGAPTGAGDPARHVKSR